MYTFLWDKNHKVKKTVIIQEIMKGGLHMIDVVSKLHALKATWITKLLNKRNRLADAISGYLKLINLNLPFILTTSFRKSDAFEIITRIPKFYQQIFTSFNQCKSIEPITNLSNFSFLTQPIWGNEYFKFKNKLLYFKNWIEGDINFVKDLFDKNGCFISEQYLCNKLKNKHNWMTEYLTLKKIMKNSLRHTFDTGQSQFIQHSACFKTHFWAKRNLISLENIKSKDMYNILLIKKYEKPYVENMWQRQLCNETFTINWAAVYLQNFKSLKYPKFMEFKFKIIHNILPCGASLSKWNNAYSGLCGYCGETETTAHLLYNCPRIKCVWSIISNCMKLNVLLKHVILGIQLYNDNYVTQNKLLCVVLISYAIYSTWCKSNINNEDYKHVHVISNIKQQLVFYLELFRQILVNPRKEHFKCLINCVLFHLT